LIAPVARLLALTWRGAQGWLALLRSHNNFQLGLQATEISQAEFSR
jgi:hypothetical protein